MRVLAFVLALLMSTFSLGTEYDKNHPLYGGCGNPHLQQYDYTCHWDETNHIWIDRTFAVDMWFIEYQSRLGREYTGERVPVRKNIVFRLNQNLFRNPERFQFAALGAAVVPRRFVGINVEGGTWPDESRVWPHLGINYVGTVADRLGYETVLWDELQQGPAPLDRLIKEGDVVGLSLVTTGIDRGVVLAHEAKLRGAAYVIAGNDSAIFRAPQLLRIPDIDAVATSDSLVAVESFLKAIRKGPLENYRIPNIATRTTGAPYISNEASILRANAGSMQTTELFTVPNLRLFGDDYWETVWGTYRSVYGKKHANPDGVRNALGLLAHGCGRAGAKEACYYCSIGGVAYVRIPGTEYLQRTVEAYQDFGINTFFNVADSSVEMGTLVDELEAINATFDTLVMYGRAQIIAQRPDLLDRWMGRTRERLLINCGIDSADESILQTGISKSSSSGSRLDENRLVLKRITEAGERAHLHFSLIFGSPGETEESCKRNLDFLDEAIATLGNQLDVAESDIWWVNFGAPCAEIFHDYDAARCMAEAAGNTLSVNEWHRDFAQHAEALSVPWSCEEAWYRHFTRISVEQAQEYVALVNTKMKGVPGHITGREFAFKPPTVV